MKLKDIKAGVSNLKDVLKVQCSNGNWNYDNYMHGLANGLILALSLVNNDDDPKFLNAPEKWLSEKE